ncbi:hypothetical protein A5777_08210 [Gordonia sp. 852002-10350_SCH5691597]|nr:hypothetical protein A5777_08210 [Gordonia sp. 852002-10350_SCH5691597]
MRHVVARGVEVATPENGHSVHADVRGLRPAADYFYRFRAGGCMSAIGRTRTAPAHGSRLSALTFAFASCQSWADGHYPAYVGVHAVSVLRCRHFDAARDDVAHPMVGGDLPLDRYRKQAHRSAAGERIGGQPCPQDHAVGKRIA